MRYGWLVTGGVAATAVAAYLVLMPGDETPAPPGVTQGPSTADSVTVSDANSTTEPVAEPSEDPVPSVPGSAEGSVEEEARQDAAPSFDAVRVGESGIVVAAGRAEPLAEVTVLDGAETLGHATADAAGDWVFVSEYALGPGAHELSLRMEGAVREAGGQASESAAVLSDNVVVLVIPEAQQDIAGRPATAEEQSAALALLVPRAESGPTTVLQMPLVEPGAGPDETLGPAESSQTPAASGAVAASDADDQALPPTATAADPSEAAPSAGAPVPGAPVPGATGAAPVEDPESMTPVQIDVVDYDQDGQVVIGGQAAPGAELRLYVDDSFAGRATGGQDGGFRFQPEETIPPGIYRLRVDQIDAATGETVARAETPFQREAVVPPLPEHGRVVVQPGASLWRIARNVYGHGVQYTVIYQANSTQIRDPDLIYPGQVFTVPAVPTGVPSGVPASDPT